MGLNDDPDLELLVKHDELSTTPGTTVVDESPNGYDGTLTGGLTFANGAVAGQFGNAMDYQAGVGYRTEIGDQTNLKFTTGPFTLSCWCKTIKDSTGSVVGTTLINKKGVADLNAGYTFAVANGYPRLLIADGAAFLTRSGPVLVNDDIWHHVAATVDASKNITVYTDGNPSTSSQHTLGSLDTTTSAKIGLAHVPGAGFDGTIDDVRIYSRALSGAEIAILADDPYAVPFRILARLQSKTSGIRIIR